MSTFNQIITDKENKVEKLKTSLSEFYPGPEYADAVEKISRALEKSKLRGGPDHFDLWYAKTALGNLAYREPEDQKKDIYTDCMRRLGKMFPKEKR